MRERCVSFMEFFVFLNKNLLFFNDFVKKKRAFESHHHFLVFCRGWVLKEILFLEISRDSRCVRLNMLCLFFFFFSFPAFRF